ncbi:MAG: glycosyltransferase family 2 protein [Clostridia bacterium]|nr:glycosyltransferase family 2 protein [Clostridia bacterium]
MFSVIIPAYNAEKFIDNSVKSVLSQTCGDFELIIIDDGSCDGTRKKIAGYSDTRIKYIYQKNSGVSSARNRGICESKGEFICFLDSDDEWKINHLETLVSLIKKYEYCGMFLTGYDIRLNTGELIHKSEQILKRLNHEHIESDNGFDVLLKHGYFFNTNTVCCRKEVFDRVGLFEVGVKNGEDDDMWYRIFSYYSIAITKKSTTIYNRDNCGATSRRTVITEPFFMKRVKEMLRSEEILPVRKKGIQLWAEQNKLSRVRQYLLAGNKKDAFCLFKQIDFKKSNKTRYLQTLLCWVVPTKIIRKYIDTRDYGYYSETKPGDVR